MHLFIYVLLMAVAIRETVQQSENSTAASEVDTPCAEGECVPYFMCLNGTVITDGKGILDARFGEEENPNPVMHPCKGLFNTCCTLKSTEPILTRFERKTGCGHRNVNGVGVEISNAVNNETQFGEFPWTIAIFRIDNTSAWTYQCGGSLIHPSVVLTAAHCVYGIKQSELTLRAGEWDTQTTDEPWPHQERNVEQIVIHENFDNRRLYHDMALLYLTKPVDLVENVNTVCLPPQAHIFDGSRCFASGWGKDQFGLAGKLQVIQKKIELPVVERSSCVQQLRTTRLGAEYKLHESFICAGGEMGKDTCSGDGGSPLSCPIGELDGQYYQSGMVSWGIGCGNDIPGAYVNVALYRDWIDEQFDFKKLDKSFYTKQWRGAVQLVKPQDTFQSNQTNVARGT